MVSFTKVYALIYQIGLIKNKKVIIIQHFGTFCDFKKTKTYENTAQDIIYCKNVYKNIPKLSFIRKRPIFMQVPIKMVGNTGWWLDQGIILK